MVKKKIFSVPTPSLTDVFFVGTGFMVGLFSPSFLFQMGGELSEAGIGTKFVTGKLSLMSSFDSIDSAAKGVLFAVLVVGLAYAANKLTSLGWKVALGIGLGVLVRVVFLILGIPVTVEVPSNMF